jgi:hypothetical protein
MERKADRADREIGRKGEREKGRKAYVIAPSGQCPAYRVCAQLLRDVLLIKEPKEPLVVFVVLNPVFHSRFRRGDVCQETFSAVGP